MKYLKLLVAVSAVSAMVFFGYGDCLARGGGGFHGGGAACHGGGWSGGHAEGFHGGEHAHNINPDHQRNPDRDHHRNNDNNNNNNNNTTNNYNYNGDDGDWGWGVAAGAITGMAVGAAVASSSQPNTVIVEQAPAQPAPAAQSGSAVGMLPPGAQAKNVNGEVLYVCNGLYYKPYFGSNGVYYVIVPPPGAKKS